MSFKYVGGNTREKILNSIEIDENGCWLWKGSLTAGYGVLPVKNGRCIRAHRASYREFVGEIPLEKPQLDHTCHDPKQCDGGPKCIHRRCVNPLHLKPATNKENSSSERGRNGFASGKAQKDKTACPQGHLYDSKNTGYSPNGRERYCRACGRMRAAAKREKNKKPRKVTTHCPKGHEYTPENTSLSQGKYKVCKICKRARKRGR